LKYRSNEKKPLEISTDFRSEGVRKRVPRKPGQQKQPCTKERNEGPEDGKGGIEKKI